MYRRNVFAVLLCMLLLGGAIAVPAAAAESASPDREVQASEEPVSIWLESEPRLRAPIRTLVSDSPQTYVLEFAEPMNRESVAAAIREQAVEGQSPNAPKLEWFFRWENDRLLKADVQVTIKNAEIRTYLYGDYRVDVRGALTSGGKRIKEAPVFMASIQVPTQLWRYSASGESRELLAAYDEPYSFLKLSHSDRYLIGSRPTDFCECDAVLDRLYALYDLEEKRLIPYPVKLDRVYRGTGDFVADRRGFFYERPAAGIEVPGSAQAVPIHVDGYVHGASFSKDGRHVFLYVGDEDQTEGLSVMLYSLESGTARVLEESIEGAPPHDQGFGRKMAVEFRDDGKQVYFVLHDGESYREIRYAYDWEQDEIRSVQLPIPDEYWSGYSASSDGQYRLYANGGLYRGEERLDYEANWWSEHWLDGTHRLVHSADDYQADQLQYTGSIRVLDAGSMEEKTLYEGLYHYFRIIGTSGDGNWIYVSASQPFHAVAVLPAFGSRNGKLDARFTPNADQPIAVYLDGARLNLEHPPLGIDDEALYVPMREVLEAAGWKISWQTEGQRIVAEKSGRSNRAFSASIGSAYGEFNGRREELPLAPRLVGDTTYLYAGILQMLGMKLDGDDHKRVLFIRQTPETGGLVLPDGSKYEGGLKDEQPSGQGMLFDKLGRLIYEGGFENGVFHGSGRLYDENGKIEYAGQFERGEKAE
ncbi:stalk domain-containing protein [Paenibacillus thermoaerophilus]|uniref:Stalk domain-containing protein n=1 Tax=Paenibacillus thermoaerophilus TaxID=1215385 RepID=A0ABW2V3Y1_9BACL|nr:stalk domain-containing protein [Paenibacillus thermoaerophilus]TMV18174.1 hypothetical protein FE781_04255 [Paenibacillus thermoaerophilus]